MVWPQVQKNGKMFHFFDDERKITYTVDQGCQIHLDTTYQNGENIPNGR
jgi:hypothetical protein